MACAEEFDVDVIAEELFEKRFTYEKLLKTRWNLNQISNEEDHTEIIQELKTLKSTLNSVKSSLNDFDIAEWSPHTNFTNPSAKILPHLKKSIHPELATQAWSKFYELLSYGGVVPRDAATLLCSVHLCEAPGGFICALNHFLKTSGTSKATKHLWVGNTLNPYYEGNTLDSCIVDDRLISRTLRSWCFGKDNTGDILSDDFILALQAHCSSTFRGEKVKLVTADGSLNCQDDPSEQESLVAPLHYTELLWALCILSAQGNFVIKMFTLFETHSITFMYILCCLFHKVSVIKPATSKAGNSEVYVVAQGYCGLKNSIDALELLKATFPFQMFIKKKTDLFPIAHIPSSFLNQHLACVKLFTEHQIHAIQRNIHLFRNISEEFKVNMKRLHDMVTQKFFDACNLRKLPSKQCIVTSGILRSNVKSNLQLRPRLEGSFTQRKATEVEASVCDETAVKTWASGEWKWIARVPKGFWWNTQQAVVGKPLQDIHSSLFCATPVVVQYDHAYEQLLQKNLFLLDVGSGTSINSSHLLDELLPLISLINSHFVNVAISGTNVFHTGWLLDMIKRANSSLVCEEVPYSDNVAQMKASKTDFIVSNLVMGDGDLKWPELKIRPVLVKSIFYMVKNLNRKALCFLVLPSILTRLTGQLIWVFSQCFDETLLHPVKSAFDDTRPAVLFVGKGFNFVKEYLHPLKQLCDQTLAEDRELLELFPITALLHTDSAAPFIAEINRANESCLSESVSVMNRKMLEQQK